MLSDLVTPISTRYWVKGGFLNLSFFHYIIGNGLANIYIHNWIKVGFILKHKIGI